MVSKVGYMGTLLQIWWHNVPMHDEGESDGASVAVSMEISGTYDDVLSKLSASTATRGDIEPLVADIEVLLETLVQMDGGTRSAIAEQLPPEMTASFDAEAVVETLQVLERYELVELVGNTWKPGPALQD